ncbi:MAG: glycosyl hydrolase 53 family protein, partial [Anaerotruncus sp.]|nr:glycosyl hydrolase 53 family protein [Anaerotruncus sp.]
YFVQLRIAKVNTKDTDNFLQHLLGIFYWEPAWLPVKEPDGPMPPPEEPKPTENHHGPIEALFSYTGKALPTLYPGFD